MGRFPGDIRFFARLERVIGRRSDWSWRHPFRLVVFSFPLLSVRFVFLNDFGGAPFCQIHDGVAVGRINVVVLRRGAYAFGLRYRSPMFLHAWIGADDGDRLWGSAFIRLRVGDVSRELRGGLFFRDLTSGWIRAIAPVSGRFVGFLLASGVGTPVALAVE